MALAIVTMFLLNRIVMVITLQVIARIYEEILQQKKSCYVWLSKAESIIHTANIVFFNEGIPLKGSNSHQLEFFQ